MKLTNNTNNEALYIVVLDVNTTLAVLTPYGLTRFFT